MVGYNTARETRDLASHIPLDRLLLGGPMYQLVATSVVHKRIFQLPEPVILIDFSLSFTETDAPFMFPRCLPNNYGRVCHPGMALCVANSISELRQDRASIADILRQTTSNVACVYRLPSA